MAKSAKAGASTTVARSSTGDPHAFLDEHRDDALADFTALLRIPSISALREHDPDLRRAAAFVRDLLARAGLEHVEVIETAGAPLVYADWLHARGKPTVLIYAHYDVQPVDPLGEWETPPFEPAMRDGKIFARGATDDKHHVISTAYAVRSLLATRGRLPVNVRFLIEGEEESSGEAIEAFVRAHPKRLKADVAIVADGGMLAPGHPGMCFGCRGILYTEIVARGAVRDLHSGGYGGNAPNPLFALAQIVTSLKDPDGHINIPGLYELICPPSEEERRLWPPFDFGAQLMEEMQAPLVGEPGLDAFERAWVRPTLEVHGFIGGFQDEGSKTVIPAEARVKVSLRLVPDQTPENVLPLLKRQVAALTPSGVVTEVRLLGGGRGMLTDPRSKTFQAIGAALAEEFGVEPWSGRGGGSVPIAATFQEVLGSDTILLGFGLPEERAHSPNERTLLANFYHGMHAFVRALDHLGEQTKGAHA
jgi:acetylornithine deacetylase/succinyl-diaminopimelate desuccinylase-like protein